MPSYPMKLGRDGKLYQGAAGATAATEIPSARDVTVNIEKRLVSKPCRGTSGNDIKKPVTKAHSIDFDILWTSGDASCAALLAAAKSDNPIAMLATDGATNISDADFQISGFNLSQPLEDGQVVKLKAESTAENRNPA
jgi:hypothetical protein